MSFSPGFANPQAAAAEAPAPRFAAETVGLRHLRPAARPGHPPEARRLVGLLRRTLDSLPE